MIDTTPAVVAAAGTCLGASADFPDGRATAIVLVVGGQNVPLIVVRRGPLLRVYRNACPHLGTRLDERSDRILSADGERLVCSGHAAHFSVSTGQAVRGLPPTCALDSLAARETEAGDIVIDGADV